MTKRGLLLVLSAPSGAGKHALVSRVRELGENLTHTISVTTRPPRRGEIDGRDYVFIDNERFDRHIESDALLEWAEVHGHRYGTLKSELDRCLDSGKDTVLELDIQGMRALRRLRDDVISVFLMPPSFEELERRLRVRNANDEADLALRLRNAREEIAASGAYDHVIVNDDLDRAANELIAVIRNERENARQTDTATRS